LSEYRTTSPSEPEPITTLVSFLECFLHREGGKPLSLRCRHSLGGGGGVGGGTGFGRGKRRRSLQGGCATA